MAQPRSLFCVAVLSLLLIAGSTTAATADDKPIRALLVIGGCCHDYEAQKDLLTKGISARANVVWTIAYDPDKTTAHMNPVYENPDWAAGFDVVVHDECSSDVKDLTVIERILRPHREGVPAVVLHCGMHCYRSQGYPKEITPWFEFTGLPSTGHGPQLPIEVTLIDRDSPILQGLDNWTTINEELYNNFIGNVLPTARVLARGAQQVKGREGKVNTVDSIVVWTNTYNEKTKVFATTLGHNNATVEDPRYLDLVTRGLLWSVGKLDAEHLKPAKKVLAD